MIAIYFPHSLTLYYVKAVLEISHCTVLRMMKPVLCVTMKLNSRFFKKVITVKCTFTKQYVDN